MAVENKAKKRNKTPIAKYNETLSKDQLEAKKVIDKNVVTTLRGVAGTGKTFCAIAYALEKYSEERRHGGIDGIVMTRAMMNPKHRDMGFLPGNLFEKIDPWLVPINEIIKKLEGGAAHEKMLRDGDLDIAPLAVVKGRTFTNKVVIVDESADLTKSDIQALFTRIGKGSKMIFMGDIDQCDLPKIEMSGFPRLCSMADLSNKCGDVELTTNFRDPVVIELLDKYPE